MGEYFPAMIEIGGRLNEEDLESLANAANEDGCGFDWDDSDDITICDITTQLTEGQCLCFTNPQARYGNLDALQNFCKEHDLPYRYHNDAYGYIEAGIETWDPVNLEADCPSNNRGEVLIGLDWLEYHKEMGHDLAWVIEQLRPFKAEPPLFEIVPWTPRRFRLKRDITAEDMGVAMGYEGGFEPKDIIGPKGSLVTALPDGEELNYWDVTGFQEYPSLDGFVHKEDLEEIIDA